MNRIWIRSGSGMHLKFAISMVALLFTLSVRQHTSERMGAGESGDSMKHCKADGAKCEG